MAVHLPRLQQIETSCNKLRCHRMPLTMNGVKMDGVKMDGPILARRLDFADRLRRQALQQPRFRFTRPPQFKTACH